jgi:pSer/pThr/pTyr-binding forkhead associated (FHA) protein
MWKLFIEDDEGKRTVVPLSRDDYSIGRAEGNTIRLTERNISRTHARLRRTPDDDPPRYFVVDLDSYNGLFVNGLRVAKEQEVQHGDLIQIGDYRLELEDDSIATDQLKTVPIGLDSPTERSETAPTTPTLRRQTLTERPHRFVMLVGPAPGLEYPLDRERLTVGRAEECSISVNHNSVSRLHCEVHALGDSRFEIVDKGSSNGVRVNGADLRRSIIEAGDIIELGDVRFKFVGAGQIFVPGPNESQQLTTISDRDASVLVDRRGTSAYLVPIIGAAVAGALVILGIAELLKPKSPAASTASTHDPQEQLLATARERCTVDDCEQSHAAIQTIAESSPWRKHGDFEQVTATWAESLLRRAESENEASRRKALLTRVLSDANVSHEQRQRATETLAAVSPREAEAAPANSNTRTLMSGTMPVAPSASAVPMAPAPKPPTSALERAREAALRGEPSVVRQALEQRVRSGRASTEEANLVRQACKAMGDRACSDDVKAKYPAP